MTERFHCRGAFLSCELLRRELIDVLVSETLFSQGAMVDPQEETEVIAMKGTETTSSGLRLFSNLVDFWRSLGGLISPIFSIDVT